MKKGDPVVSVTLLLSNSTPIALKTFKKNASSLWIFTSHPPSFEKLGYVLLRFTFQAFHSFQASAFLLHIQDNPKNISVFHNAQTWLDHPQFHYVEKSN